MTVGEKKLERNEVLEEKKKKKKRRPEYSYHSGSDQMFFHLMSFC